MICMQLSSHYLNANIGLIDQVSFTIIFLSRSFDYQPDRAKEVLNLIQQQQTPNQFQVTQIISMSQPPNKRDTLNIIAQATTNNLMPNLNQPSQQSQATPNINQQYYFQYKKSYNVALQLSAEMIQLVAMRDQLWGYLSKLDERTMEFKDVIRGQPIERKRRARRGANQIQRIYQCQFQGCGKSYGTEGSLNQHIRIKHGNQQFQLSVKKEAHQ